MTQEIDIPLDLKRVVLLGAEETKLGDKKGRSKTIQKRQSTHSRIQRQTYRSSR